MRRPDTEGRRELGARRGTGTGQVTDGGEINVELDPISISGVCQQRPLIPVLMGNVSMIPLGGIESSAIGGRVGVNKGGGCYPQLPPTPQPPFDEAD